jgi:hypothetical protein
MLVTIATRKITISPTFRGFIHRSLKAKLRRFAPAILAARAELSDRNGRRGGGDKRCRILLTLADGCRVMQDDIRASVRHAFCGALDRTANAAHRRLRVVSE